MKSSKYRELVNFKKNLNIPRHSWFEIKEGYSADLVNNLIKDLKIKGSSSVVKGGTKVRNIRLQDAGDGHDIACKIDGIGSINLKSEFVRKA